HAGSMTGSMLRRFFWGLGAAVLTYVVVPKMRRMAKPAIEKGVSGVKELAERGKQTIEEYRAQKDDTVDMVKDASLEHIQVERDKVMSKVNALSKINALQETIDRLKKEIMGLKNKL
ncbi:MAG: hypothetical protein GX892_06065, partial [Thermoanaerobacteraceae bacterium]|nr:hypothetical protein [Thermoanaerobacteraceae bacterium]